MDFIRFVSKGGAAAWMLGAIPFCATLVAGTLVASDARPEPPPITVEMVDSMKSLPGGLGALPPVPVPRDNPQTSEKVELGRHLFFDTRLSLDYSMNCASCHDPSKAFTDGKEKAIGFHGRVLTRNSPTILNSAYNRALFWDGRAVTLEEQAKMPLLSAEEMNMVKEVELVKRLNAVPEYAKQFKKVFNSGPSLMNVEKAIAAFERTLVTPDSRFDQYARGNHSAMNDQEKRGLLVFFGKASCTECHSGPNFSDDKLYALGDDKHGDLGRYNVTHRAEDKSVFKTPTLRNIALTAPYMHNGSMNSLEDVVEFYNRGGDPGFNKSKLLHELNLTPEEKADLVAFLKTLTGTMPAVEKPEMYPDGPVGMVARAK